MLRASFRTALAHKGRLALSGLAVVLGVAFVAGTYVFTDTLQRTFGDLFDTVQPDVQVLPAAPDGATATTTDTASLPASAVDLVADVNGVALAAGTVQSIGVTLVDSDGEAVGTAGPPKLGVSWSDDAELSPLRLVEGRGPQGPDEIAIDTEAFDSGGFALGDIVRVLTPGPSVEAKLVGVFRFGTSGNLAGATLTAFEPQTAQQLLLGGDRWSALQAVAVDGVSQEDLADAVRDAFAESDVGPVLVQTGEEAQDEAAAEITDRLGFITTLLLFFAGVALFVGGFIIVNTFSVLIARRTRELALLRAVGASRRQVTRSVLLEAFLVGLVGGVLGLALGVGLAIALRELFGVFGFDIPAGTLVVLPRTVVAALLIGVLLTMAAAFFPARRAGAVAPVAALRDDAVLPTRSLHRRTVVGSAVTILGASALALGLLDAVPNSIVAAVLGIALVFVGVVLLSAVIGGFAIGLLGRPVMRTTVGRLAVRNAQRDRRRTAATAGALMIGLALVTTIGVVGSSSTKSVEATIADVIRADFIVASTTFQPFSPEVGDAIEAVDGVDVVSRLAITPARLGEDEAGEPGISGAGSFATGVDPSTIEQVVALKVVDGSLAALRDGGVALDTETAQERGLNVGDALQITWPAESREYEVVATYSAAGPLTGAVVARDELTELGAPAQDNTVYVTAEQGVDATDLRPVLDDALAPYPIVTLQDQTQLVDQIRAQVNQLLSLLYTLLGLAVIIAILGIVNTLLLSVLERTREIGLLRAVGTDRRQVRQMVRIEAILIAVFGALLGIGLGLLFGIAIQQTLVDDGISELGIPWTLILVVLVVSAVVGVLAAIVPARRAANLDVLGAIATE